MSTSQPQIRNSHCYPPNASSVQKRSKSGKPQVIQPRHSWNVGSVDHIVPSPFTVNTSVEPTESYDNIDRFCNEIQKNQLQQPHRVYFSMEQLNSKNSEPRPQKLPLQESTNFASLPQKPPNQSSSNHSMSSVQNSQPFKADCSTISTTNTYEQIPRPDSSILEHQKEQRLPFFRQPTPHKIRAIDKKSAFQHKNNQYCSIMEKRLGRSLSEDTSARVHAVGYSSFGRHSEQAQDQLKLQNKSKPVHRVTSSDCHENSRTGPINSIEKQIDLKRLTWNTSSNSNQRKSSSNKAKGRFSSDSYKSSSRRNSNGSSKASQSPPSYHQSSTRQLSSKEVATFRKKDQVQEIHLERN